MKKNNQTWVKVNVPIDSEIAPIVSLMSRINNLRVMDCVQEQDGEWGRIYFSYGSWEVICGLLFIELTSELDKFLGMEICFTVGIESAGRARGEIRIRRSAIPHLLLALRHITGKRN